MLTRGRIFYRTALFSIIIGGVCTMSKVALIAEPTYSLLEKATRDIEDWSGWCCLRIIDICVIPGPLYVPKSTVTALATNAVFEVSETMKTRRLSQCDEQGVIDTRVVTEENAKFEAVS